MTECSLNTPRDWDTPTSIDWVTDPLLRALFLLVVFHRIQDWDINYFPLWFRVQRSKVQVQLWFVQWRSNSLNCKQCNGSPSLGFTVVRIVYNSLQLPSKSNLEVLAAIPLGLSDSLSFHMKTETLTQLIGFRKIKGLSIFF